MTLQIKAIEPFVRVALFVFRCFRVFQIKTSALSGVKGRTEAITFTVERTVPLSIETLLFHCLGPIDSRLSLGGGEVKVGTFKRRLIACTVGDLLSGKSRKPTEIFHK